MINVVWGESKIPLSFKDLPEGQPFTGEPEITAVIERFARPGDCMIDVGAGVGIHTCFMSRLVGPEGLVLAFEPHDASFMRLYHNVHELNKLSNVGILKKGLWYRYEPALKLNSINAIGYSSFHKYADSDYSELVEGLVLDDLLDSAQHPRLIKIDCEGAEEEVLLGARRTLERGVDCVILEFNYYIMATLAKRQDHTIRDLMDSLGYSMYLINVKDENGDFLQPLKFARDEKLPLIHWINVMFSTDEKVRELWGTVKAISGESLKAPRNEMLEVMLKSAGVSLEQSLTH